MYKQFYVSVCACDFVAQPQANIEKKIYKIDSNWNYQQKNAHA